MNPKKTPRNPPNCTQKEVKRGPPRSRDQLRLQNVDVFQNLSFPAVILRFLRVGGPSCERKIDPMRFEDRGNNDFEEARTRGGEKKSQTEAKESPKSERPNVNQPLLVDLEAQEWPQETPKSTQKRPRETQRALETSVGSKTSMFSKTSVLPQ